MKRLIIILVTLLILLILKPINAKERVLEITRKNTICVCNDFTPMLVMDVLLQTSLRMDKIEYIVIESRGGYTMTIWPIQHLLKSYPDATIVVTNAMSAAALLAVRLPNKRVMYKDGMLLFHKVYTSAKINEQQNTMLKISNYVLMWDTAQLLGMNYVDYKNKIIGGDWIILPAEALYRGIISEIVDLKFEKSYL